jgi:hypothetical protein
MERNGDRNVDELIDLGSVVAETKGGQVSGDDSILQRQQTGSGWRTTEGGGARHPRRAPHSTEHDLNALSVEEGLYHCIAGQDVIFLDLPRIATSRCPPHALKPSDNS